MDENVKKPPMAELPKKEDPKAEAGKPNPKTPPKPRVFMIDQFLRNAIVNLIGAGSYNSNPPIPSRDVVQIVAALNNLRPYDLKVEQTPPPAPEGKDTPPPPAPPRQMRVFIMDELLRNMVVNLLGAGTFSHVPAAEVIRIVGILNSLRPFDVTTEGKPGETTPPSVKEEEKKK